MTQYTSRDAILARLALAERDEESLPLGGAVRLVELTRAQLTAIGQWAASSDAAAREHVRGAQLAYAVSQALGDAAVDSDALRQALVTYSIGAPEQVKDPDRWNAGIFAAGVIDPETKQPLFAREEVLQWPGRPDLWSEVLRLAQRVLDLSEVGQSYLKSGDPAPAAE